MTDAEKDAIRQRVEKATTGPWRVTQVLRDAEFIAHAREDIPALLVALEASERNLEECRQQQAHMASANLVLHRRLDKVEDINRALSERLVGIE